MSKRIKLSTGNKWENLVGYSRAVKAGNVIEVSGTVAVDNDKVVGVGNAYDQTRFILERIKSVLEEAGSSLEDVVRTRMFVKDINKWDEIAKAHKEFFEDIKPATTMVEVSGLIHRDLLVEIEATAILIGE